MGYSAISLILQLEHDIPVRIVKPRSRSRSLSDFETVMVDWRQPCFRVFTDVDTQIHEIQLDLSDSYESLIVRSMFKRPRSFSFLNHSHHGF
jgi:hypothetical protein